jgi:threonylcarbamoyladenosine tRNA methylthiotransferase MtaB
MFKVVTLGCRINAYESEVIKEKLAHLDDVIVINTCAVTGEAERQCRQTIRKLAKENPAAKIIVTGCAAQIAPQKFAAMPEVDLILGNKEKASIERYLQADEPDKTIVSDIMAYNDYDSFMITGFEGRHRAFVQIQQGCNYRCSYCIVPYARGHSRSVASAEVLSQIRELLEQGFKEICLTGVDVCSYKVEENGQHFGFSDLIHKILAEIPELPSLQFGSLDPAAIDDKFIALVGKYSNLHPHFHFSIQSGDNEVLKKMRRRHSREDVINLCAKIRAVRPESTFGADFICGFPTETEEQFMNTVKLVREAKIEKLHVFPYSERPGTPAAAMTQVPVEERKHRAMLLRREGADADA